MSPRGKVTPARHLIELGRRRVAGRAGMLTGTGNAATGSGNSFPLFDARARFRPFRFSAPHTVFPPHNPCPPPGFVQLLPRRFQPFRPHPA